MLFTASHKSINEWGRSINKTAAQYFSDKLYKANVSPVHFKTALLEGLSSHQKKKKKAWNQMVLSHSISEDSS